MDEHGAPVPGKEKEIEKLNSPKEEERAPLARGHCQGQHPDAPAGEVKPSSRGKQKRKSKKSEKPRSRSKVEKHRPILWIPAPGCKE